MLLRPERQPLTVVQVVVARGVNSLDEQVDVINAQVCHSPCNPVIMACYNEGLTRKEHAGDIKFARYDLVNLHPESGHVESQVHIIGEYRLSCLASAACHGPVVAAGKCYNSQFFKLLHRSDGVCGLVEKLIVKPEVREDNLINHVPVCDETGGLLRAQLPGQFIVVDLVGKI